MFELGFFNLGNPNKTYVGIWYKNIPVQNIVWVANSAISIKDSSAILKLNSSGNLVLTQNNTVVWCTSSEEKAQNPVAELLDSGNLVIRDENEAEAEAYLWQSFDHPSNTMLPGMKLGWDLKRNLSVFLKAWKSDDDPTPGDLSWGIVLHPYPELYMMKGPKKHYRHGPWNGLHFSGKPLNTIYHYEFVSNKEEVYLRWRLKKTRLVKKVELNQTAQECQRYVWSEKSWILKSTMPVDYCDNYGVCGANTYCSTFASTMCHCLKGFKPKSPEEWNSVEWSQGCVLKHQLSCKDKLRDSFFFMDGLKVPDTEYTIVDDTIDLKQCSAKCLNNCSCMAYTNSNISGAGSGCVMWFGDLFDIKLYSNPEMGQRLYIRFNPKKIEATLQISLVTLECPQQAFGNIGKRYPVSTSWSLKYVRIVVLVPGCSIPDSETVFIAAEISSLTQSQFLSNRETLVSPGGMFELGFFNLGNPNKTYLGIWYKNIPVQNIVWVANSAISINDSSTILKLNSSGNLVLTQNNTVVWCTSSEEKAQNPVAELLESGNLVIRDENEAEAEAYLWQSFDHPSNTMLPGMKLGWDLKRNLSVFLKAWKSYDDPTPGDLSWGIVLHPYPEMYMMKGPKKHYRHGPWNGLRFSGRPLNTIYHYKFVSNKGEGYFRWSLKKTSLVTKVELNQTAQEVCGANTYCTTSASAMCDCLKGFKPKSPEKWNSVEWSQGCVLQHSLNCEDKLGDDFFFMDGLKVPDTEYTFVDETIDLKQCRAKCLNNCSCMAYTNSNISGAGSGCVMWFGDLFDIKLYSNPEMGQRLYLSHKKNSTTVFVTSIAATFGVMLAIYSVYRRNISEEPKAENNYQSYVNALDLSLLD
ncbi:Receptor-like serine/threonine-protein [Vigna angularis]|uniref:Receptor-like serine/threonine-protein n=1 Tax=Phaseolus angularis TaxID=3914 RepID=A0A8T0JUZ9_PHAAN|nr:Receptor-like serine/threonine-protein [Vigna angularis]